MLVQSMSPSGVMGDLLGDLENGDLDADDLLGDRGITSRPKMSSGGGPFAFKGTWGMEAAAELALWLLEAATELAASLWLIAGGSLAGLGGGILDGGARVGLGGGSTGAPSGP